MKRISIVIIAILLSSLNAFAQAPAATSTTTTTTTTTAQAPAATPPVVFAGTVRAKTSVLVSRLTGESEHEITLVGRGLKDLTEADILITDGAGQPTMLDVSDVDATSDTQLKFKVTVPQGHEKDYYLRLKGKDMTNVAFKVKDTITDLREKADVAVAKAQTATAVAGAQAKRIDDLKQELAKANQEIANLRTRPTLVEVNGAIDTKVNAAAERLTGDQIKLANLIGDATKNLKTMREEFDDVKKEVDQLGVDTGILAENIPKKGGVPLIGRLIGKGPKVSAEVVGIRDRRAAEVAAAREAAIEATRRAAANDNK